jgi:4'-phosphopantetheinyl transferase
LLAAAFSRCAEDRAMQSVPSPVAAAVRSTAVELQHAALELWVLRAGDVDATQLDLSVLDREERQRAARLAQSGDRQSYLAGHILLRQLLGRHLGLPPQDIAYLREPCRCCGAPHGRPALDRPSRPLHFSLSRSGEMVLIAIASAPVGADIEALPQSEVVSDVSTLLHVVERREICSTAPPKRAEVFTRLWTRKEAYLKGVGIGVTHDLALDYLGTDKRMAAPEGWTVANVPVAAGYAAAVAVSSIAFMAGDLHLFVDVGGCQLRRPDVGAGWNRAPGGAAIRLATGWR